MADIQPFNNELHHLVRDVSEADERSIPNLLLKLKDILGREIGNKRIILVQEIWKYEFPNILFKSLEEDFSQIAGEWLTCILLVGLLVDLCVEYSNDVIEKLLGDVILTILQIFTKIVKEYQNVKELFKSNLRGHLASLITSTTNLIKKYKFTASNVLTSKHFMQFLMIEDVGISLLAISLLKAAVFNNREVFDHISESRTHNIADELAFKITATKDQQLAKISMRSLLFLIDMHEPLLHLFSSKRYRGFKTYITKWYGNGFDQVIHRFVKILDIQFEQQLASQKFHKAAILIQSVYRGHRIRQEIKKSSLGFAKFQRIYRERKLELERQKERHDRKKLKKDYLETRRRKDFVNSKSKQLEIIKNIPARTVDSFLDQMQHDAATKIQAAWIGTKTRRMLSTQRPKMKRSKAAVVIQRQVRKWLFYVRQKRDNAMLELMPSGLTDERRVQLQGVITNIRERFPKKVTNNEEFKEAHDKTFCMLNNHIISLRSIRRRDEHRKALLAQLSIQSDQLLSMPPLHNATVNHIEIFASKSAPVIVAGRNQHNKYLVELKKPWWAKLNNDEDVMFDLKKGNLATSIPGPLTSFSPTGKNIEVKGTGNEFGNLEPSESLYLQDHEKQF